VTDTPTPPDEQASSPQQSPSDSPPQDSAATAKPDPFDEIEAAVNAELSSYAKVFSHRGEGW